MANGVKDVAKELAKSLIIDTLKEWFSYIRNYHDNMKELQNKYHHLVNLKDTFTSIVEQQKQKNLHKSTKLTDSWLSKVQNLVETSQHLIDEKTRKGKDQCCFGHVNCNLQRRYEMSKTAELIVNEIESVIKNKPDESMITEPRLDLKSTPNEFMTSLSSRVVLMEEILKKLRDDQVNVVGVFGMGAIGKTTLAKEIANKGAKDMFKKTMMVEISESPNVENIQGQIAEQLKLNLEHLHSIEQRANRLYTTLTEDTKILVILDNIWGKFDLGKVGIPQPNENCKLLVTSRKKDVCEVLGASTVNIFEVHPLDEDEARLLFKARVGAKADDQEEVVKKMLSKCGGPPLSIVALADVLKNQELSAWGHFATELEKPMSISQAKISGVHRQTYSILETSYKLMESKEKRRFFLLACLFPFGASIPVEDIMRYGIGLGLFQHVNNLIEAMELAKTWVDELISSALLLEDKQGYAKIHDLVRESTISLAEKGGKMVMVEALPRWLLSETCQKYYAISLMSGADHSRLNGLNSRKLQILILDGTLPQDQFSDGFFERMKNLKVLVLKRMKFRLGLPNSIRKLKRSLITLLLERCNLGDITVIGELTNLVVLSLSGSSLEEFPEAIGNLCNLHLLDLTECSIERNGIAANVLSKLSQLEGLYAINYGMPWRYNNDDSKKGEYSYYARIAELNNLSFLKLFELGVAYNDWPIDDDQLQFLNNLDHFLISFGNSWKFPSRGYSRGLSFNDNDSWSSIVKNNGVRVLLEKTQFVWISRMGKLQHINDDIQQQEEDETKLQLSNIHFPHLQQLVVTKCPKMQSLSSTPFKATNLTYLRVGFCISMKYIFMEHDDVDHQLNNAQGDPHITITFPCLKRIALTTLPELESVTGLIKHSTTTNDDHHILFNHKAIFPLLEDLRLSYCHKIVQLWEVNCKEMTYYSSFNNLHYLQIHGCKKLESLGSLSIATALKQLKTLSIRECPILKEVISSEEEEEIKAPIAGDKILPSLETVGLLGCPKLKMFVSIPREYLKDQLLKLSSLQHLEIDECPEMQSLSSIPFKAPNLTSLKINKCSSMKYIFIEHDVDHQLNNAHGDPYIILTFPCLKRMELSSLKELESVTGLIKRGPITNTNDHQPGHHILFGNHKTIFPSLEHFTLIMCDKIVQLWEVNCKEMSYYSSFNNLHRLYIGGCEKLETLGYLSIATALVQLKTLTIKWCPLLKEVISSNEEEEINAPKPPISPDKILPSLESVELIHCPELKMFISIGKLKDILQLPSLHKLKIQDCPKMDYFSSVGPSFKTLKLIKVILDSTEYSKDKINDNINSFLQSHNKPK